MNRVFLTLAVLFATVGLLIPLTYGHSTGSNGHNYVNSFSFSGRGNHVDVDRVSGDVWVHDFVWQEQEAIAAHYIYLVNYEAHTVNYGYRFDFSVHWLWKRTGQVRDTLFATNPRNLTQGRLAPNRVFEARTHNSYDISPHNFWIGEKFKADAQTVIAFWKENLDNQGELSISANVSYTIPEND